MSAYETGTSSFCTQRAQKVPAAMRRPTTVAPIPVAPRAPLLPLKATVGESVAEVFVDVPVPGIELLGVVELIPEVERELPDMDEAEIPEVEELDRELEEMGSLTSNVVVWERTLPAFPTLVARREYPPRAGTEGRTTVTDKEVVVTLLAIGYELWATSFTR